MKPDVGPLEASAWAEAERLASERKCATAVYPRWRQAVESTLAAAEQVLLRGGLCLTDKGRADIIQTYAQVFVPVKLESHDMLKHYRWTP